MGTIILLSAVLLVTAVFSFVVAGRDAPNAIALPIASGALTPVTALSMTAVMRMVGVVMGIGTVQSFAAEFVTLIPSGTIGLSVTLVGVTVALVWALLTWWKGVAVSSSHALTAGMTGGALAVSVFSTDHLSLTDLSPIAQAVLISLLASPILAAFMAWLIALPVTWLVKDTAPHRVGYSSRGTLAISAAANALGHGIQYGQRIYIVALMALATAGVEEIPHWVLGVAITLLLGLGTFMPAWRLHYTLTQRITRLDPLHSAIASSTSALLLLIGSLMLHIPLSSSLTTVAAITGAGTSYNSGAVRWNQVLRLIAYFVFTVIICAAIAFLVVAIPLSLM